MFLIFFFVVGYGTDILPTTYIVLFITSHLPPLSCVLWTGALYSGHWDLSGWDHREAVVFHQVSVKGVWGGDGVIGQLR